MIWTHVIDSFTEEELLVFCNVFESILVEADGATGTRLPLYKLSWLRKDLAITKLLDSKKTLKTEHQEIVTSIIKKLRS